MHASVNMGCQGESGPGKIHEVILVILHLRFIPCYLMTFPADYDKFTIPSRVRKYFTIRIYRRANITHKPTSSFGGYFSSVTESINKVQNLPQSLISLV